MIEVRPILDEFVCRPGCPACKGTGHVCEDHPNMAWEPMVPDGEGCGCGAAGMPCLLIKGEDR